MDTAILRQASKLLVLWVAALNYPVSPDADLQMVLGFVGWPQKRAEADIDLIPFIYTTLRHSLIRLNMLIQLFGYVEGLKEFYGESRRFLDVPKSQTWLVSSY